MLRLKSVFRFRRLAAFAMAALFLCGGRFDSAGAGASAARAPQVFCDDAAVLVANKTDLAAGDVSLQPALRRLLAEADDLLPMKPLSVMDKKQIPPSGDKHDFISQAPYFWRDTNSPGVKYIRHDGRRNPEAAADSDSGHFQKTCAVAHTLALAYYFSGDERYATKAAELIRVWFLNPATKMNPNLNFGQGIPGQVEGRPAGLISARGLVHLVDAIGLLAGSKSWAAADQRGMTAWFTEYLHWLTTSKIGRGELAAKNNHGTYCDTQVVAISLFLGKTGEAKNVLTAARQKRIARQIEPDGRQPFELVRTTSFGYGLFNLRALMDLANLGRCAGVDLWHYQTADGRSLLKATEFMAPYADPSRQWPFQQIHRPNRGDLDELLLRAAAEYPASQPIKAGLQFFKANNQADNPARLYLKLADTTAAN